MIPYIKNKWLLYFLVAIFIILIFSTVKYTEASEVRVDIQVDKKKITLDDRIQLTISIEGSNNIGEPKMPYIDGLDIVSAGKSSKIQVINGQFTSSIDLNYILIPQKKGRFTIPSIPIKVKRKLYKTDPISIEIADSLYSEEDEQKVKRDVFVTSDIADTNPYVNQQIIYNFKFFRKNNVKIKNASLEQLDFDGFYSEKLGKEREYNQIIDNQRYIVTEIKYALFPLSSGMDTIPPAKLKCDILYPSTKGRRFGFGIDNFFDDPFLGSGYKSKTRILTTKKIDITVKPLPQLAEGLPKTDLVGNYRIKAQVNKNKIQIGDSATLSVIIEGKGNIQAIKAPDIPNFEDFKYYEDKPELKVNITDKGIEGEKIFKKAIVPLKEGKYKIPKIDIIFLDAKLGDYRINSTEPIDIVVLPGEAQDQIHMVGGSQENGIQEKKEIVLLHKDILPIKSSIDILSPKREFNSTIYLILFLTPPLMWAFLLGYEKRKLKYSLNQISYRYKRALKMWDSRQKKINSLISNNGREFYVEASRAFRDFLGDRLNIAAAALTPDEISYRLNEKRVSQCLQDKISKELSSLEMGQFGTYHQSDSEQRDLLLNLQKTAKALMKWI